MKQLRSPEEILAYRSLKHILAAKPAGLWAVEPTDVVLDAVRLMAEKNVGLLLVMEGQTLVGVVSERDCVRRVLLAGKSPDLTPIVDIMVRNVIKADITLSFGDCLALMHAHGIRHLPVVDNGNAVGVISVRDLLREAVAHHARVIGELERERMTMLTSTA